MAVSKIQNPSIPIRIFNPTTTGSSQLQVYRAHGIAYGRFVRISARVKVLVAQSNAMNMPFIELSDVVPSGGDEFSVPGTIVIHKSDSCIIYADLVTLKKWENGTYYAKEDVTSNLSANDYVDFDFSYISV